MPDGFLLSTICPHGARTEEAAASRRAKDDDDHDDEDCRAVIGAGWAKVNEGVSRAFMLSNPDKKIIERARNTGNTRTVKV